MHINKNKQNGSSTYATMFILLVLIFAAVTLMKLWAPYFDDMAVKTALKNLSEEYIHEPWQISDFDKLAFNIDIKYYQSVITD